MKKLICIIALILPFMVNAMKITTDEIDEFYGYRRVETSWERICGGKVLVCFLAHGDAQFLKIKYFSPNCIAVTEGSELKFKSVESNILILKSLLNEIAGAKSVGSSWLFECRYEGNMEWFLTNTARLMRIDMTGKSFRDIELSEKDGRTLTALYTLLSTTIDGDPKTTMRSYNLTFLRKKTKSSGWDIIKEEHVELITDEELYKIVNEWKDKTSENAIYDVKIKKDR